MSDKAKKIIKNIIIAILAVWALAVTFLLYVILREISGPSSTDPSCTANFLDLTARVNALEMGTTWDELVAEHEENSPTISTGEAVQEQ